MTLFFVTFFTLYSLLHLYLLIKANSAFNIRPIHELPLYSLAIIIPFIVVMIFSPLIIRQSEKHGLDELAMVLSYIGYSWMGLLVLFCSVSIPIDILGFIMNRLNILLKMNPTFPAIPGNISFILSVSVSIAIFLYGYFEARDIKVERLKIISPKVTEKVRVVQISDLHIGLVIKSERVKRVVELVNNERPDIVVSTGDLVDGQINSLGETSDLLRQIRARYGKFAITGNHEFYAGLNQAIEFIERAGFRILRGKGIVVANLINIAGVDDPAGKAYGLYVDISDKDLLSQLHRDKFTLLLRHRPTIDRDCIGLFDLQLSGHTHKGQIFPFSILTGLYYPVQAGRMNITDNSYLYVSRGTGTWGPPIRFLSPPEITVIDLIPE